MADMDVSSESGDSSDVGIRLKMVRNIYGISQRELARRAGVTNATISFIEQGRVSPSVGSLNKILGSVPMSLAEFFSLELGKPGQIFFRANEMPDIGQGGVRSQLLGGFREHRSMSILRKVFPVGRDSGPDFAAAGGEVGGIVVAGELEVAVGSDLALLRTGDGFYFSSRRPHRFRNPGSCDCIVVYAATPAQALPEPQSADLHTVLNKE
ncbi:HTH-type transcriptional regulator PuuR [Microbulbifer sp. NBRC 101763]|uniref:helix-turn-helix domain-containing protein n=1 Tax=unclassified Microbulbifer TaxID=2619833 RepID=UPI0024ADF773|nr:helix-turn-helix domain-containing protein [Microbulbifer sp. MLAF003]WHI49805.1 helix-turn-helix domain-containing protein [Microbulbifer sp. MLAF003]